MSQKTTIGGAELVMRDPEGPLQGSPLGATLRKCEKRIAEGESQGIEARWEFGRALLRRRKGKQLPKGLLDAVIKEHGISNTEISQRVQFAETFTTKEEVFACAKTYPTWNRIKREALPKKPKTEKDSSRPAFRFRRWRNQIAQYDPTTLTDADVRELKQLAEDATAMALAAREHTTTERKAASR